MKDLKKKLTNTKTVLSLVSLVILILTTWGMDVPQDKIMTTVKAICSLGVLLGIMNDNGMATEKWDK